MPEKTMPDNPKNSYIKRIKSIQSTNEQNKQQANERDLTSKSPRKYKLKIKIRTHKKD
jgi:hypothetical protein